MIKEGWQEGYKSVLMKALESIYKPEVLKEYTITDIILKEDKFLFKWEKRFIPLK